MSTPAPAGDRLRVLCFCSALGGGGAEMHLLRILNHLDRERFQLSLALARPGGSFERLLRPDVEVSYLTSERWPKSSTLRLMGAIPPLRALVQRQAPDLIFSVMDHVNVAGLLAVRSLPRRPAVVVSVQNPPTVAHGRSWNPVKRSLLRWIPRLYPIADAVVAISRGVADDLLRLAPRLASRVSVISNAGLDDDVLRLAREPLPPEFPRPDGSLIVACGRLTEQKGYPELLEAVARIRTDLDVTLWIVGEGPDRPALERRIETMGLADRVRLLGFQANPYRFMAAADVFALSSRWEGFGNVVVEALACGTAVVATSCEGPREVIRDGVTGLLVSPRDPAALAGAIHRLLREPELRQRIARAGQRRAEDFHARSIGCAHGQLFDRVVRGNRRPGAPAAQP